MSFSPKNVKTFKNKIADLQEYLGQLVTEDTTGEIVKFENQLTLNELDQCLSSSVSEEELEKNLKKFLADRWERIRKSTASYTQQPLNDVNLLCLELANTLSPLPENKGDYDGMDMGQGPYFLLMPSLTVHQTLSFENIHHLKLHEFVLSDNEELFEL
jgi:hypothetical protein